MKKARQELRYLTSCRACGASNGMNAAECWQCEGTLRAALATESAPPELLVHSDDESSNDFAQPSFSPVLRETPSERAANDDADAHSLPPIEAVLSEMELPREHLHARRTHAWRWAIGASLIAGAAGWTLFMPSPWQQEQSRTVEPLAASRVQASTPGRADVSASTTSPNDTSSQRHADRSPLGPEPPAEAKRTLPNADPKAASHIDGEIPAPAPVNAPCTPQVAALGLCSLEPA
jgi:ribosomal protein L40E